MVFGTKAEKVAEYRKLIQQGVEKGTNDGAIVVDKSLLGEIANLKNQGLVAFTAGIGFVKCKLTPENMVTGYAQDKIIAKVPAKLGNLFKTMGRMLDVKSTVSCYIGATEDAWTSESGQKVLTHELCLMGEDEFCGDQ